MQPLNRTGKEGAGSLAERVRAGAAEAVAQVARGPVALRPDNLVERPWGGRRLAPFKGLPDDGARRFGESFEVAAWDHDPETRAHPSVALLSDGSELGLPELLEAAGPALLGETFFDTYGAGLPVLPKLLDVKELLSVQSHPPGHPELYVVLEAEPGATIRLGFSRSLERRAFRELLGDGLEAQRALLALMRTDLGPPALQAALAPALASRAEAGALMNVVSPFLRVDGDRAEVERKLRRLRGAYLAALDALNEVPVQAGQVLFNAVPGSGPPGLPSSDVHALGNADQKGILILEIRRPGPTLRAWDHVRYPVRDVDLDGALATMHLEGTAPERFVVEPVAAPDPGLERLAACDAFVVDRVRLGDDATTRLLTRGLPQTLHVTRGEVEVSADGGALHLGRGRSALVPARLGAYVVTAVGGEAEAVRVTVPVAGAASVG